MKYFIDQEFITGFHKPLFGKNRQFIDLVSIGIVCEDGREYYAISNEFNINDADDWVKKNVIGKLKWWKDGDCSRHKGGFLHGIDAARFAGKSNKEIADEVFRFIHYPVYKKWDDKISFIEEIVESAYNQGEPEHEFYGYYSDYDWVLFCSLFGRMIDLPKGFPMYCNDLKQTLDEVANKLSSFDLSKLAHPEIVTHNVFSTFDSGVLKTTKVDLLKRAMDYPKQENEHNALDDARWNKKLYEFLQNIKNDRANS